MVYSSQKIKKFILDNITLHQKDIIHTAIQRFGVSRQAILKHMHALIAEKQVLAYGKTRDRIYELRPHLNFNKTVKINEKFYPREIVGNYITPHLDVVENNIKEIIQFSMTALMNNILEHSKAKQFYFKLFKTYNDFHIIIRDNGIGIFKKIQSNLDLEDCLIAAMELAKGRITTDSENHSGDELNAILHLFDIVKIEANRKSLIYNSTLNKWMIENSVHKHGTSLYLKIDPASNRNCEMIFKKLFDVPNNRLTIPISLIMVPGMELINSRTQAKSILRNIENFSQVTFDFNQVELIGPAFADELVRESKKKNNLAKLNWINSSKMIDVLMSRALKRFT